MFNSDKNDFDRVVNSVESLLILRVSLEFELAPRNLSEKSPNKSCALIFSRSERGLIL